MLSATNNVADVIETGGITPVNPASPAWLRERSLPPAAMSTRRAGCHESGLSGSTEARRSKASTTNRVTIPAFYPIAHFLLFFGIGATEKNPVDAVH